MTNLDNSITYSGLNFNGSKFTKSIERPKCPNCNEFMEIVRVIGYRDSITLWRCECMTEIDFFEVFEKEEYV